jgi:outer membrane protein assembly factor BamB
MERWRTELSFDPTWLTAANGSLIVAGENGAVRLSAADGRSAWQFRVPPIEPWFDLPGWHDPEAAPPVERLSGFYWTGGRLVARLGARSLVCFDGGTGRLVWQQSAPMARQYQPAYHADDGCVVAQSTDGQRWVYDAADGHVLNNGPAPNDPWPNPPLALDQRRMLVVEDGRLVALDRATWESVWTWDLPRPVSLTGEQPQTRVVNAVLLVGVARNDCYEIERLDPVTGQPLSAEAVAVGRDRVDFGAVALDGDVLHVVAEGELRATDCRSGATLSHHSLQQSAHWQMALVDDGLLLWSVPTDSPATTPLAGQVLLIGKTRPERQRRDVTSLALELGPGNCLRSVRVIGNEVVLVSESEIRGFRGANREVK